RAPLTSLYVWGASWRGQLGLGDNVTSCYTPKRMTALPSLLSNNINITTGSYHAMLINKVCNGWGHTMVLADDGHQLLTWGSNMHGQCGIGVKSSDVVKTQPIKSLDPGNKIIDISCGSAASIAVVSSQDGNDTYIWGSCGDGKLGGNQTSDQLTPERMHTLPRNVKQVSFGTDHCIALCSDNRMFGWGFGQHGALGVGGASDQLRVYKTPVEIPSPELDNKDILHVECSIDTSFAIVRDREV
ncbi:hypothetical protein SAMD00019534_091390, partial [Acytostelium subglobosum LB1]|uniref:hypothetical protein n=1 Tax=Acytostelium subglobosum LB1 TaxID=1410327 RepID=UPI000644EE86